MPDEAPVMKTLIGASSSGVPRAPWRTSRRWPSSPRSPLPGPGRWCGIWATRSQATPASGTNPDAAAGTPVGGDTAVALAAGDVTSCSSKGSKATGELITSRQGAVLALGDLAYSSGTADQFKNCYDPVWGGFKDRTYPVPGNHEYMTAGAAGYYAYFGTVAGDPSKGYYSFDLGRWHIVALNSNCDAIGGCKAGSPQAATAAPAIPMFSTPPPISVLSPGCLLIRR